MADRGAQTEATSYDCLTSCLVPENELRVGRREFAARFDAYVLFGDAEPPGLWTVILADGSRLRAGIDEDDDRCVLYVAAAPVPGLPDVRVDEGLWRRR
ncbi:hypothetical protein [Actinoallomurus iriomotensis]|uniref:Uncharacterized protein n=1 Tax=Actinoallomurus iriomotensis TaxID=478107 RepID=A0A9W6SAL7_9ACTN|nr:hypothetical protein [Actinoallomurus iriomotensis]GLY88967.1 hypothetical protein Airi02_068960 [Actinoallomurus iriomotensis]